MTRSSGASSPEGVIVPLSLQSRRVGEITVVTCTGRIVEGDECARLHQHLEGLLPLYPYIILNLEGVPFIDSSGLGLLVRFLNRTRTVNGSLKLCAVPDRMAEVLRVTKLSTLFDSHHTEAEAISAFYQPARSTTESSRFDTDILCVEKSTDVLAYIRELLRQAGYGVMTAGNLPDALILLQATQPKVVVVGADLHAAHDTRTAHTFNRLADQLSVIELPAGFSSADAGEAGRDLLDQVRAIMSAGRAPRS